MLIGCCRGHDATNRKAGWQLESLDGVLRAENTGMTSRQSGKLIPAVRWPAYDKLAQDLLDCNWVADFCNCEGRNIKDSS